ncbi:ATP-grasp domain-containing protein [Streptomyces sp. NPDC015131]|uniref:ATP-grasp domain-containing protein n=1 Tax=Streptomyces sp. NPDC015131 TaxID=3364941 RepID=UPI003700C054
MSDVLVLGGAAGPASGHVHDICLRSLRQLVGRGCRVVLTDTPENLRAGAEIAALAHEVAALDPTDPGACLAWIRARPDRGRFRAVFGYREFAQVAVAEVAAELGLPGNPPDAVRTVRNKDECRERLAAEGFRQPACRLVRTEAEGLDVLASLGGTAIVKPRGAAGSTGVSLVTSAGDLPAAFAAASGEDGAAVVEAFVSGPEFSVEGIWLAGEPRVLAVTEKRTDTGSFVESGHLMPARLDPGPAAAITAEVTAALLALKLSTGLFHVECWLTEDGPVLGEVHVRQGGDWIHAMLEWCRPGLELYGAWYDDMTGRPVRLPEQVRAAATRFVMPPAGVVTSVTGWEAVDREPDVLAAACTLTPGEAVRPAARSGDRRGLLVVGGPDAPAADRRAGELLARLRVAVRPA